MANERVSELAPITAAQLAVDDLFLLADVSAIESKKLQVSDLNSYMQSNITGSATSSWALNTLTASYIWYQGFSNGTASCALTSSYNISSSYAISSSRAITASYAITTSYAITASYAISASYASTSSVQLTYSSAYSEYAKSASYLIYTGIPNGTASYSMTASLALTAKTASHLLYTGVPNGTASYALYTLLARTSSYLLYSGVSNGTASYAMRSNLSVLADGAKTSSFLDYNGIDPNGTASYAITASYAHTASYISTASYALAAKESPGVYRMYGPFVVTLSTPETGALALSITSSTTYPYLIFEFCGDHGIPMRLNPGTNGKIDVTAINGMTNVAIARCWAHSPTSISEVQSITQSFFIRAANSSLQSGIRWNFACNASNCNFQSAYNPPTFWVYSNQIDDIK